MSTCCRAETARPSADGAIFTEEDAAAAGGGDGDDDGVGPEDTGDEDDDEDDEDIVYVPPPRETAKFAMSFTERIFPTPLRESKVGTWRAAPRCRRRCCGRDTPRTVLTLLAPTPPPPPPSAQEEDWIAKNKVALDKRRKQLNPDARDISERDRECAWD